MVHGPMNIKTEADHSPLCNAEVKNQCTCFSTRLCIFMACSWKNALSFRPRSVLSARYELNSYMPLRSVSLFRKKFINYNLLLRGKQNSAALISNCHCHNFNIFFSYTSILYHSHRKDERAKPGKLLIN
jgi:hypothetical protein